MVPLAVDDFRFLNANRIASLSQVNLYFPFGDLHLQLSSSHGQVMTHQFQVKIDSTILMGNFNGPNN